MLLEQSDEWTEARRYVGRVVARQDRQRDGYGMLMIGIPELRRLIRAADTLVSATDELT